LLESLCAIAVYGATLVLVGAGTAAWLVGLSSAGRAAAHAELASISRAAAWSARLLCVALLARLLAHTQASFDTVTIDGLRVIAWQSRWGQGWRSQIYLGITTLILAVVHLRSRDAASRVVLTLLTVAVVGLCYVVPLVGHAATDPWTVAVAGTHLLGTGGWLGTLAMLVLATRAASARPPSSDAPRFARFSPLALTGAAVAIATGTALAAAFLGSPLALVSHPYGRLLALKLVLFAAVCGCGFINWRAVRSGSVPPFATWELGLSGAIVVVTGFLTEAAHP
jgi:putative copper resistance protein D